MSELDGEGCIIERPPQIVVSDPSDLPAAEATTTLGVASSDSDPA